MKLYANQLLINSNKDLPDGQYANFIFFFTAVLNNPSPLDYLEENCNYSYDKKNVNDTSCAISDKADQPGYY
jgi:hypothetical protein